MPIEHGGLYVSAYGFYLHAARGVFRWPWSAITAAEMVGPAAVHFNGDGERGPISWILRSDWSELVFVLWALPEHPRHPQLRTGAWLPPGWLSWAATQYRTRLSTPEIHICRE